MECLAWEVATLDLGQRAAEDEPLSGQATLEPLDCFMPFDVILTLDDPDEAFSLQWNETSWTATLTLLTSEIGTWEAQVMAQSSTMEGDGESVRLQVFAENLP